MNIRPLADRIIVRRAESNEQTDGGIFLPDQGRDKPLEGTVIAVGPGHLLADGTRAALEVEVGQRVIFGRGAGAEVRVEGEDLLILRESEVFIILCDT